MAKTSMVNREEKRAKLVKRYAAKRARLKEIIRKPTSSPAEREAAVAAAAVAAARFEQDRASETAARLPAGRAVSTASSVSVVPSCAKQPCAAKFRASGWPAGNSWYHWSTT